jgi:hypothetical protein
MEQIAAGVSPAPESERRAGLGRRIPRKNPSDGLRMPTRLFAASAASPSVIPRLRVRSPSSGSQAIAFRRTTHREVGVLMGTLHNGCRKRVHIGLRFGCPRDGCRDTTANGPPSPPGGVPGEWAARAWGRPGGRGPHRKVTERCSGGPSGCTDAVPDQVRGRPRAPSERPRTGAAPPHPTRPTRMDSAPARVRRRRTRPDGEAGTWTWPARRPRVAPHCPRDRETRH